MLNGTTRRSLAGPGSAGALYLINPVRVYDSRRALPSPGTLGSGATRYLYVADGRDQTTGAVDAPNAIPSGAQAIVYNLTALGGSASGSLGIVPGNASTYTTPVVRYAKGQLIANASIVKLDAGRQVKVYGGGGPCHFILEVTGYYL